MEEEGNDPSPSPDSTLAQLLDMGFDMKTALRAVSAVGTNLHSALDHILTDSARLSTAATTSSVTNNRSQFPSPSAPRRYSNRRQSQNQPDPPSQSCPSPTPPSIVINHSIDSSFREIPANYANPGFRNPLESQGEQGPPKISLNCGNPSFSLLGKEEEDRLDLLINGEKGASRLPGLEGEVELGLDWEERAKDVLRKRFGHTDLKGFQWEALQAWAENRDCLVLAATGSGKSLCFQIPALLTSKVVVVISPLISLMHDQCLKLARHGIPACFLGSGQCDNTVEAKAMNGAYSVVYICPETLLRLVAPLRRLALTTGIALFAIDEVHCISKWGHDFRPDYRRLNVLRANFSANNLRSLKYDIPIMALTATATIRVREDIVKSLSLSCETKLVLTSFFRPNLRFLVKHSRTSRESSYGKDFCDLVSYYMEARKDGFPDLKGNRKNIMEEVDVSPISYCETSSDSMHDDDHVSLDNSETGYVTKAAEHAEKTSSRNNGTIQGHMENEMSVEFLEDELDTQAVDYLDVACGEFTAPSPEMLEPVDKSPRFQKTSTSIESVCRGPTIIYVPTRKETIKIASYLSKSGVKAAAYHAKLPKSHLRSVHEQFHQNKLEVVVATIAFGMGIDKPNVRKIIHYGWPQSLEAYFQEAGRAGRDGNLSDCILYADLSRIPTLLPSKRDEEQTIQAYKMLSDCYRYAMGTSSCRASVLVKYFGEDLLGNNCSICDICVGGPPDMQDLTSEGRIFLWTLDALNKGRIPSHRNEVSFDSRRRRLEENPSVKMVIEKIQVQNKELAETDQLWWRGLVRILECRGYIREADGKVGVSVKYPMLTDTGLDFLTSHTQPSLIAYPEADMLLALQMPMRNRGSSEWGRGWADPHIRQQRLGRKRRKTKRSTRERNTVRGRLQTKLTKFK